MMPIHITARYFLLSLLAGVGSLALGWISGKLGALIILAAMGFVAWTLRRSETKGFIRSGQMRRAFEPERHYSGVQTAILFGLLMVQALIAAFVFVR